MEKTASNSVKTMLATVLIHYKRFITAINSVQEIGSAVGNPCSSATPTSGQTVIR